MPSESPTNGTGHAPLLLTLREVAAALQCSERTVWTLADKGELPSVRLGRLRRFRRESVELWLKQLEAR